MGTEAKLKRAAKALDWEPERYPEAFHAVVIAGGGVLYYEDVPWSINSTRMRFGAFLTTLRMRPEHALHQNASVRWRMKVEGRALFLTMDPTESKAQRVREMNVKALRQYLGTGGEMT